VIEASTRGGPARPETSAAHAASGEILLFIDADVCVAQKDTLRKAVRALADDSCSMR